MIRDLAARLQTALVLVGLVVLFGIASPHFLTADNLLNVMQQSAINAILGIGLTFVIISAGIDLSVGSILALCGLVVADLLVAGHSTVVAIVGRAPGGPRLRPGQRADHDARQDPAVHHHPGHDADRPQRGQDLLRLEADQRPARVVPRAVGRHRRGAGAGADRGGAVPARPSRAHPHQAGPLQLRHRRQRAGGLAVRRAGRPLQGGHLRAVRSDGRGRRGPDDVAAQRRLAAVGRDVRALRDRRSRHRRGQPDGRRGRRARNVDRRPDHGHAPQRPQRPQRPVGARRDGRRRRADRRGGARPGTPPIGRRRCGDGLAAPPVDRRGGRRGGRLRARCGRLPLVRDGAR